MTRKFWIAALMVSVLTGLVLPWMSPGVLALAGSRSEAPLNLSVIISGYLQANGWFKGPVLVHAQTDDPQASLIYSLDGGPAISGQSIILAELDTAQFVSGAAVILTDPIFQGLAISLLFGLASSTLLTVLVIPAIYVVLKGERDQAVKN